MGAGTADQLLSPDGLDATNQQFVFRTSGGEESISDGDATIEKMYGKTIVWNQLSTNVVNTKTVSGVTFTNNGDGSMSIVGTASSAIGSGSQGEALTITSVFPRNNHKVLVTLNTTLPTGFTFGIQGYGLTYTNSYFFQQSDSSDWTNHFSAVIASGTIINITIKPQIFDLTKMFGSGNEPYTK